MFRYSLVLLAGLGATAPAAAATWADALFEELTKDFGSVPRGPTLVHPFRLTNSTSSTVSIAGVRVSCGCVSASATKTVLRPGEEAAIVARMDTTRFTGPKSVTIYVTFDRPNYQEARLWVQANGRNDFSVAPDSIAFGQIKRTATPAASTTITFYGTEDLRIVEVRGESNYVRAHAIQVRRGPAEVTYKVTARLREDVPVGKWYTDLWVQTNSSTLPQVRVPLTVEVESPLSVTPEVVSLGKVKVNSEGERRVVVRGVKPFKIRAVQAGDADLSVTDSANEAKAVHVVTVKLKPTKAGTISRKVHLITDLEEDGEIEFQVKGQAGQ
jgi:hypothetical protein